MADTPDKNPALAVVIEKLTEIVDNINQGSPASSRAHTHAPNTPTDPRSGLASPELYEEEVQSTVEVKTEPRSPNRVVINLPVKVGGVSITDSTVLLESLKQLDNNTPQPKLTSDKHLFKCTKCDYTSSNKHYLKQHVFLVHTAERPFKCPLCDYAGKRSHSLKEHLVVHSPYRPFTCPFCSASFRKKGHLTNHIKLHSSEQAVACSICNHFIANRAELSHHMRKEHVGEDLFTCTVCEFATVVDSDMIMHMHSHGNNTVYRCSSCKYLGVHEDVMKKHVHDSHGGDAQYTAKTSGVKAGPVVFLKCSECGYTTNDRSTLKEHMISKHISESAPEATVRCDRCSFTGPDAAALTKHVAACHKPTRPTDLPVDTLKQGYTQDKAAGLYCCMICGYTCDHQRTIKAHIWKHSGHKDINYPTFQNGPLSIFTDGKSDGKLSPAADSSGDKPGEQTPPSNSTDTGATSKKRPSELDFSMPKLKVMKVTEELQQEQEHQPGSPRNVSGPKSKSPVGPNSKTENSESSGEEECRYVIDSDMVEEVVVETTAEKEAEPMDLETLAQKPVSLRTLLQTKSALVKSPAPRTRSGSQESNESTTQQGGISSSLLAVIEQFRNDASTAEGSQIQDLVKVQDRFRCQRCQATSRSLSVLQSHVCAVVCSKCQFTARSSQELRQHTRSHHGDGAFTCKYCAEVFSFEGQLLQHMATVHKKVTEEDETAAEFICENCESCFKSVEQLLKHKIDKVCWKKSATGDAEEDCFKCNFCDYVGMSVRSLKSHMKRHWNDLRASGHFADESTATTKKFVCEKCAGTFPSIYHLLAHKPETCTDVGKHLDESKAKKPGNAAAAAGPQPGKMYKCEQCDFVSKSYNTMDAHLKKHIEPQDLGCSLCDFMATSVRSLKSHMKRHANDQRFVRQPLEQYKCNMCGYICHHLPALKSHMWRHASDATYSYERTNAVINAAQEMDGPAGVGESGDAGESPTADSSPGSEEDAPETDRPHTQDHIAFRSV